MITWPDEMLKRFMDPCHYSWRACSKWCRDVFDADADDLRSSYAIFRPIHCIIVHKKEFALQIKGEAWSDSVYDVIRDIARDGGVKSPSHLLEYVCAGSSRVICERCTFDGGFSREMLSLLISDKMLDVCEGNCKIDELEDVARLFRSDIILLALKYALRKEETLVCECDDLDDFIATMVRRSDDHMYDIHSVQELLSSIWEIRNANRRSDRDLSRTTQAIIKKMGEYNMA